MFSDGEASEDYGFDAVHGSWRIGYSAKYDIGHGWVGLLDLIRFFQRKEEV